MTEPFSTPAAYELDGGVKGVSLEATIIRKDGRIEHLGLIQFYHESPWRRLWHRLRQGLGLMGRPSRAQREEIARELARRQAENGK